MAAFANAALLNARLALTALLALQVAGAATVLRLEEAASRLPTDFSPVYAGKVVEVKGVVSSKPITLLNSQQVAIQEGGYGLVLQGPIGTFDKLNPGDEIDAVGKIWPRTGLVTLYVAEPPRVLFHGAAPAPLAVELD